MKGRASSCYHSHPGFCNRKHTGFGRVKTAMIVKNDSVSMILTDNFLKIIAGNLEK